MAIDLSMLNPQQREAATTLHGPVLVLAGAGTGKTMVITRRIACLLDAGIKPENILAVTFTNKAAREMKERIARLLPHVAPTALTVSTFHSFCCRVLRQYINLLGYDRRFGIADDTDQEGVLKEIIGDLGLPRVEQNTPRSFQVGISHAKNLMLDAEATRASSRNPWYQTLADVYARYQRQLKDMNLVDFDDLLLLTVQLWREHKHVLAGYREQFQYLLVDEFQDTNQVQAEIVRLLAGERRNLCVVGDDDQSIYGWRGADVSNILGFPENYPGCKIVKLEQNYRSTNNVLKVANHLIARNANRHLKQLWSAKPEGELLRLIECEHETDEAQTIGRLMQEQHLDHRMDYGDMAVLYRSKYQSRVIEQQMRKMGIPYRLVGSQSFYQQREIKDAVAYLRILHNSRDDLSLLRILNVPPRGIGSKSIDRLKELRAAANQPMLAALRELRAADLGEPASSGVRDFLRAYDHARQALAEKGRLAEKLHDFLVDVGYLNGLKKIYKDHEEALERQENLLELINAAHEAELRYGEPIGLETFLEDYALTDDNDRVEDRAEQGGGVTLMTVHAAKGLEFPLVFIAGMEDKLFPHERALEDGDESEERRLFYVAVTRAKERLILLRAKTRSRYTGRNIQRPSRFLHDLPKDLVETCASADALRKLSAEETSDLWAELKNRFD